MKLELKHIAPYLPYGLKIMTDYDGIQKIQGMPDLFHVNYYDNESDNGDEPHIEDIKPILRPLSDLTKEIEVNGEKFIPQQEINHLDFDWLISSKEPYELVMKTNYEDIVKLFEWHFDVFGLIEKNLAIDINTLEK
jgi:hypothetical protein